jgi:hypothetical protein
VSLTIAQAVAYARRRTAAHELTIETLIPVAARRLARLVAADERLAHYLQRDFDVDITSGVGTFADSTLLRETIDGRTTARLADRTLLRWVEDERDLDDLVAPDYVCFTVAGDTLLVKDGRDDTLPTDTVTLRAQFIPTIAASSGSTDLPDELADVFIDTLVAVAAEAAS